MNSTIRICDIIPACCPLMNNGCIGCSYDESEEEEK